MCRATDFLGRHARPPFAVEVVRLSLCTREDWRQLACVYGLAGLPSVARPKGERRVVGRPGIEPGTP